MPTRPLRALGHQTQTGRNRHFQIYSQKRRMQRIEKLVGEKKKKESSKKADRRVTSCQKKMSAARKQIEESAEYKNIQNGIISYRQEVCECRHERHSHQSRISPDISD